MRHDPAPSMAGTTMNSKPNMPDPCMSEYNYKEMRPLVFATSEWSSETFLESWLKRLL